ncbi:uncharacterized protein LOC127279884 [Leptopilina boulardi]|uniref:uncharacterized protein LOC127279884 n=1 Tax=Leptopilina boulardi TaxID=63433 RepID=UPI0021F62E42|nr:uncharacterized protein LOC127279884 [Leptopilina boulardi]
MIRDEDLLQTLASIFKGSASRWFRTIRQEISSWRSFKKAFRREYLTTIDDDEVIDEMRSRTQAKGEKISSHITSLQLIMGHLRKPLSTREQVKIAYKGLTPTYRKQVDSSGLESLSKLERNLRQFEKVQDLDDRHVPPPPKEKMRFPAAAYKGAKKDEKKPSSSKETKKIAALKDESATGSKVEKVVNKKSKGKKSKKTKKTDSEKGTTEVNAIKQSSPQPSATPIRASNPTPTFATVAAGKGKRQFLLKQTSQIATGGPKPFVGACFTCQMVGHRVSECPMRTCFVCQQRGHFAAQCPTKVQIESCLVCRSPGMNFLNCPNCVQVSGQQSGKRPLKQCDERVGTDELNEENSFKFVTQVQPNEWRVFTQKHVGDRWD